MNQISRILSILSDIAVIAAVVVALISVQQNNWLSGSGYKSQELVKIEMAQLVATLNSIIYKYALSENKSDTEIQFIEQEISQIQRFLASQTALALYIWARQKSEVAKAEGKEAEEWRTFFLSLFCIVVSADEKKQAQVSARYCFDTAKGIAVNSSRIARMIASLSGDQIEEISRYNSDLALSIRESGSNDDLVLEVIKETLGD